MLGLAAYNEVQDTASGVCQRAKRRTLLNLTS